MRRVLERRGCKAVNDGVDPPAFVAGGDHAVRRRRPADVGAGVFFRNGHDWARWSLTALLFF